TDRRPPAPARPGGAPARPAATRAAPTRSRAGSSACPRGPRSPRRAPPDASGREASRPSPKVYTICHDERVVVGSPGFPKPGGGGGLGPRRGGQGRRPAQRRASERRGDVAAARGQERVGARFSLLRARGTASLEDDDLRRG